MSDEPSHAGEPVASRPRFAPGYGVDPRATGEMLSWEWVTEQLQQARNYWVCTAGADGRPHAAPVWGLWLDGELSFSTDEISRKARNLAAHPEIVVHLESGDDVVILEGTVEVATDREWLRRFCDVYAQKYDVTFDPDSIPGLAYRLKLSSAMAWQERAFPGTVTKFTFPAE